MAVDCVFNKFTISRCHLYFSVGLTVTSACFANCRSIVMAVSRNVTSLFAMKLRKFGVSSVVYSVGVSSVICHIISKRTIFWYCKMSPIGLMQRVCWLIWSSTLFPIELTENVTWPKFRVAWLITYSRNKSHSNTKSFPWWEFKVI